MPESNTELIVLVLFGVAVLVIPSLLAWGVFALIQQDRNTTSAASVARHSPRRRNATRTSRPGKFDRRFPDR